MMIDGLNVSIAGLEAKWCAFTQQEHRAALAREPLTPLTIGRARTLGDQRPEMNCDGATEPSGAARPPAAR